MESVLPVNGPAGYWLSNGRVLLFVLTVAAIDFATPSAVQAEPMLPRHILLFEMPVNQDDVLVGGTYRFLPSRQLGMGPFVSFDARTERLTALEQIGSHLFIQRREMRYLGTFGLDASMYVGAHTGIFASAGAGYTFGSYEGTRVEPEEGWTPVLRAGALGRFKLATESLVHLRVGYQYADLRSVASNRTYLAVGVEF